MIKTVNSSGRYVMVTGGYPVTTYINNSMGAQGVGNVRYNSASQNFEVYDGFNWIMLSSGFASVGLTPDAETILDWAKNKMFEEAQLEKLAQTNPAIADLVEQKKSLEHKIKVIQVLIREEEKVGTN